MSYLKLKNKKYLYNYIYMVLNIKFLRNGNINRQPEKIRKFDKFDMTEGLL